MKKGTVYLRVFGKTSLQRFKEDGYRIVSFNKKQYKNDISKVSKTLLLINDSNLSWFHQYLKDSLLKPKLI